MVRISVVGFMLCPMGVMSVPLLLWVHAVLLFFAGLVHAVVQCMQRPASPVYVHMQMLYNALCNSASAVQPLRGTTHT